MSFLLFLIPFLQWYQLMPELLIVRLVPLSVFAVQPRTSPLLHCVPRSSSAVTVPALPIGHVCQYVKSRCPHVCDISCHIVPYVCNISCHIVPMCVTSHVILYLMYVTSYVILSPMHVTI